MTEAKSRYGHDKNDASTTRPYSVKQCTVLWRFYLWAFIYLFYLLSHKLEWNTEKYTVSASPYATRPKAHVRKNVSSSKLHAQLKIAQLKEFEQHNTQSTTWTEQYGIISDCCCHGSTSHMSWPITIWYECFLKIKTVITIGTKELGILVFVKFDTRNTVLFAFAPKDFSVVLPTQKYLKQKIEFTRQQRY